MIESLDSSKSDILFFSPFSGNWKAALAEHQIMKSLTSDFNVHEVRCEEYFDEFCTVMNAKRLEIDSDITLKKNICSGCIQNSELLGTKRISRLSPQISLALNMELSELRKQIEKMEVLELLGIEFRNLKISKIAIFETIIKAGCRLAIAISKKV